MKLSHPRIQNVLGSEKIIITGDTVNLYTLEGDAGHPSTDESMNHQIVHIMSGLKPF